MDPVGGAVRRGGRAVPMHGMVSGLCGAVVVVAVRSGRLAGLVLRGPALRHRQRVGGVKRQRYREHQDQQESTETLHGALMLPQSTRFLKVRVCVRRRAQCALQVKKI